MAAIQTHSSGSAQGAETLEREESSGCAVNALKGLGDFIKSSYTRDVRFGQESFIARNSLILEDGFWYKDEQVAVPDDTALKQRCIDLMHSPVYCGHLGGNRTYQNVKQLFWWAGMKEDVLAFVKGCDLCQRNKPSNAKPLGLLHPLPVPSRRWESVSMDFIMQLPMTKNGHDAILVFVDRLSKMAHFVPTRTEVGTNETAEIFMREVFRLHGLPKQIVSDRDGRFISRFWKEVCRLLGIQQGMSTAYHPQTDGQTERVHRVLEDMLRAYVNPMLNDWDEKLSAVEFAVNNAWQRSTKSTPFILNFGERPHTPTEVALNCKVPAAKKFAQDWHMTVAQACKLLEGAEQRCTSAEERQLQVDRAVKVAKDNITQAQSRQKLDADKRRSLEPSSDPGCDVLLNTRNIHWKHPGARKLLLLRSGPYKVVERVGKLAYKLKLAPEMKMHPVFHVSLLKKYDAHGRKVFSPSSHIISGVEMFEIEQNRLFLSTPRRNVI